MSTSSSLHIFKQKWYRLASRFFVGALFFILGCTFTVCFISTTECSKPIVDKSTLTETDFVDRGDRRHMVILIISARENVVKRHALRRTWLSLADHESVKYYFVIGNKDATNEEEDILLTEAKHYSDLLLFPDVEEGYELLARKVLASFIWVDKNLEFDFVLKVDDDSYVNIRQLLRELLRKTDSKNLYWGYFNGHAQVKQKGKWAEKNWNLCDRYLPYARGGGYVLARQPVHYLAQNAKLFNMYKNEDVSVGTWLAPLNLTRVHDINFDTEWASRGCSNQFLITHPHKTAEIYKLHESLSNNGRMCQLESEKRPAYSYDWNVLPSQCCKMAA